jgi:hypothetical protein
LFVVDWFSVVSGFILRFSDSGSWPQLQPHDLFGAGQVAVRVDQPDGRRVAPSVHIAQVESFHRLAHEAKGVFDPRPNPGLLAIAFFLLVA